MNTIDIVILVLVIAVVLLIIGVYIYKKINGREQLVHFILWVMRISTLYYLFLSMLKASYTFTLPYPHSLDG